VPWLEQAGLRVAVSGDVEEPGVARVVNIERGMRQAKRILLVLSQVYLTRTVANFENILGLTMGIQEDRYRLLPVMTEPIEETRLPGRLGVLTTLDLAHPRRPECSNREHR
jgi:hypothetical protein